MAKFKDIESFEAEIVVTIQLHPEKHVRDWEMDVLADALVNAMGSIRIEDIDYDDVDENNNIKIITMEGYAAVQEVRNLRRKQETKYT